MPVTSYNLSVANKLLPQTFDALYSYAPKVRLTDYFYYVEQAVSIGTGATSAAGAIANLGGVKRTGDTMMGNLIVSGSLYPSVFLTSTHNGTTNRTDFEGSYAGASSFASWEDNTGNNRRMLEVRTKALESSLDWAVLLRVCEAGTWGNYRVFHSGMASGVPVANGGTGATTAADARANLGADNAGNLTTGTLPADRLPFKFAYGTTTINGSGAAYVDYYSVGFTSVALLSAEVRSISSKSKSTSI